jgi:hypothetical protein
VSTVRLLPALVFVLCTATAPYALAGEVLEHHVHNEDGHYYVHLKMRIDAGRDNVYRVLTDYDNIKRLNDSFTESRILERNGNQVRVMLVSEGCVFIFCRSVKQVQEVTPLEQGYILTVTDPMHSDLKYGRVLWHVQGNDKMTIITYNADFAPDFWVPPLFGPATLRQRLLMEAKKTINGVEQLLNHDT